MKIKTLTETSQETFPRLVALAEKFSEEEFNQVPYEGSWTPGQLVQHLIMSYGVLALLNGKTEETKRDPMKFDSNLRGLFLDFEKKLTSPDFIDPEKKEYDRDTQLQLLKEKTAEIIESTHREGLEKTCLDFTIPGSPPMTGLEWLWFMNYHTMRHTHQLEKMDKAFHQKISL
jgi:hypothetical protein